MQNDKNDSNVSKPGDSLENVTPIVSENISVSEVSKLIELREEQHNIVENSTTQISDMLKGDLMPGLVLTKSASTIQGTTKTKSKKKSKDSAPPSYSCDECDFKAAEIRNLRMHTFYTHGGKTYSCVKCDFKAQRASVLKFHKHFHTKWLNCG